MAKTLKVEDYSARLDWQNVTVSTVSTLTKINRTIIYNAYGSVKPGEFLAIMGPSGAGKTTLLKYLSKRLDPLMSVDSGEILINGVAIDSLPYASMIGFVPQDNILFTSMTPREILTFTAALTSSLSYAERKILVEKTLEDLELNSCADTIVGGVLYRGLSGGEKKRTSVGMELISNPSILFLDEPTTGLDSFTAVSIGNLIKSLAKDNNRTIIATIHQPNSQLFECFDKLLLLSKTITVYVGDANQAVDHFTKLGYPLPENYNPTDHFLKIINKKTFNVDESAIRWRKPLLISNVLKHKEVYTAPFMTELLYLTWRAYLEMIRNPLNLALKFAKVFIFSLMCISLFWSLGYDYQGLNDRLRCLFLIIFNFGADAQLSVVLTFQMQKQVFIREYRQNRYGALAYFLSYNLIVTPIEILFCIGYILCIYNALDLNTEGNNPYNFTLVCIISGMTGTGWGMLVSLLSPSSEFATLACMTLLMPAWLCSGCLINYNDIPHWFVFKYIAPFYYTYQAAVYTQLEGLEGAAGSTSEALIDELNLPNTFEEAVWISAALVVAFRILDYFVIKMMYRYD